MIAWKLSSHSLEIPNGAYTRSNSDWLVNTQTRVLRADWFILKNYELTT